MIYVFVGLLLGAMAGLALPVQIPTAWAGYLSVAVLAAMDTVLGGLRASMQEEFRMDLFVSGFFGNIILAAALAWLGDRLDVPIYLAAIFWFGGRIFRNFSALRRIWMDRLSRRGKNRSES